MPTLELRVAVWTVDTFTGHEFASSVFTMSTTLEQRLGLLREAVEAAWKGFRGPGNSTGPPYLNVFLGPEYLFVKAPDARVLTMGEADSIECAIRDLSKGVLLIPGTVVWKKPLDREADQYGSESARGARALKRRQEGYYTRPRIEKALSSVDANLQARLQIDKKEKAGLWADTILKDAQTTASALKAPAPPAIVRNTAYGYLDGQRVLKYHKRANFTEVLSKDSSGEQQAVFIPGAADGYFEVTVEGMTVPCGIEICLDHGTGYLSNASLGKTPLLHFITSAFTPHFNHHVRVASNGYVVHASSRADVSGVFTPAFDRIPAAQEISAAAGTVSCYALPLEV